MRIITISGSHSGVGKTTLAAILLAKLTGFSAIKVTGAGINTMVTDDPDVIGEEGKDTALMRAAGAGKVVWVQCPPQDLSECLSYAFNLIGEARGVLVEGNGPARLLKADLAFFVAGEDLQEMKPGAPEVLKKADVIVVNTGLPEPPEETAARLREHNPLAVITTMREMRMPGPELEKLFGCLAENPSKT